MNQEQVRVILIKKGFIIHHITPEGFEVWTKKGYWYRVNENHCIMEKPTIGMISFSYGNMEPEQFDQVLLS